VPVAIEELVTIRGPGRARAPLRGNLPFAAGPRIRLDVDLLPARLIRDIRQPTTVGRKCGAPFIELGLEKGLRLAVALQWGRPQIGPSCRVLFEESRGAAAGRPGGRHLPKLAGGESLLRATAVGRLPEQAPPAIPPGRVYNSFPVGTPKRVAIVLL